jgi:phospholipid/cholesterol/gamma-HCH transport system ATP-binding protein
MMQNKIEIRDLEKSFNENQVLKGVNLDIKSNDRFVIIGGSGSGKSVLLKTIVGLVEADSGSIKVDGQEIVKISQKEQQQVMKKFGVLFQGAALFDSLPIWRNVAFGLLQNNEVSKNEAKDIAVEKLKAVGLKSDILDLYPAELSGGMQKRVGLARAIATNPEIIFFDEPTTGLDPITANVINDLIIETQQTLKNTSVIITHDINSLKRIATKVAMLYQGKIIWQGTVEELENTDNQFLQQFIHGAIKGPITVEA